MTNINAFRPVALEKIFKGLCFIYKTMSCYGVANCDPKDFIWTNL